MKLILLGLRNKLNSKVGSDSKFLCRVCVWVCVGWWVCVWLGVCVGGYVVVWVCVFERERDI